MPRFLILIALLVTIVTGCQSEIAKWDFAAAALEAEAGNSKNAIPKMRDALEQMGAAPALKLKLAEQLADEGDPQAVQFCDELLDSNWVVGNPDRRKYVMQRKSHCQQSMGEFEAALETCKTSMEGHVSRSIEELNELAYHRALANQELTLAIRDIDKAIAEMEDARWQSGMYLPVATKTGIAIGLVSREMDTAAKRIALDLLNRQIEQLEMNFETIRSRVSETVFAQIQFEFPLSDAAENQTRLGRNQQDVVRGALASALTVRALLHQDLGNDTRCNDDRFRVQKLGYDASVLAEQMPNRFQCFNWLEMTMMVLDTRGLILGRLPWSRAALSSTVLPADLPANFEFRLGSYPAAIANMNLALESIQTILAAAEQSIFKIPQQSVAGTEAYLEMLERNEAVLLYHRMLIHQKQGNAKAVAADEKRIRELGCEPNDRLF